MRKNDQSAEREMSDITELRAEISRLQAELAARQRAAQAAARIATRTARLQHVTAALSEALTPEEVAAVVMEHGIGALGAQAGSITHFNEATRELELLSGVGYPPAALQLYKRIPLNLSFPLSDAVRERGPIILFNAAERDARYPHLAELRRANGGGAMTAIPLMIEGHVIGVLGLNFPEYHPLDEQDVNFLLTLSQQCAQALERARLYKAEQQARAAAEAAQERLAFLVRAGTSFAASLDYETTLSNVAQSIVPTVADYCVLHLANEHQHFHPIKVAHRDPEKEALLWQMAREYPLDAQVETSAAQVLRSRKPVVVRAIDQETLSSVTRDDHQRQMLQALGIHSYVLLPLIARGQMLGLLSLALAESERDYGEEDLRMAEELARRAALAVDNALLYREAQEAIRLREHFLAIASHELKTPLTSIMGYTDLFLRQTTRAGVLDEQQLRPVRVVQQETRRLNQMIDLLLDLTRLRAGQLQMEQERVNLVALLSRVRDMLQPTLEQHGIHMVGAEGALPIVGDPLRLEQIFQNLLSNAVKYSPPGSTITIRFERDGHWARTSVEDQGIGIPAESLPHLFKEFYRVAQESTRQVRGVGLGLHIVHHLVEAHGGQITVRSEPGVGSTFTVAFPLA